MDIVEDVSRPDKGGVPPKMQEIANKLRAALEPLGIPYLKISTDDNLMSSVWVDGSYDPKEQWSNGIYYNSHYFRFRLIPAKGKRYYSTGDKVELEMATVSHKIKREKKFRKATTIPENAIQKIVDWIKVDLTPAS